MSHGSGITAHNVEVRVIHAWDADQIIELYRAGGWWKEKFNPAGIPGLIRRSFLFAVAIDLATGSAVGMGRVISDGVSDGYIQDLIVLPEYRGKGIGRRIVSALLEECKAHGLEWIGLVAEPGSEKFYIPLGFRHMKGYIPLIYDKET
jgi:ribosomal protein S18 acetylase RimI-like enzyme